MRQNPLHNDQNELLNTERDESAIVDASNVTSGGSFSGSSCGSDSGSGGRRRVIGTIVFQLHGLEMK